MTIKKAQSLEEDIESVFIRLKPKNKINAHILGFNPIEARGEPRKVRYSVEIPQEKK